MIVDYILQGIFAVFTAMFAVFPDVPVMPQMIIDGWDWFITMSNQATGVLVYLLSPPLYVLALTLIIFMTTFHYIYNFLVRFLIMSVFMRLVGK